MYSVNLWACEPHTDDLCITGYDFETIEEARAAYESPFDMVGYTIHDPIVWVELYGSDVQEERCIRNNPVPLDSDAEWRREIAMEAGMLHGIDAYNEVLGY